VIKRVVILLFWLAFFGYFLYRYVPNLMEYITNGFPSFAGQTWWNNRIWFLLNVSGGVLVYTIGIIQFTSDIRNKHLKLHRSLGKGYVIASLICIITLAIMIPEGLCTPCRISQSIVTTLWLVFVTMAWYFIKRRNVVMHQRMMISSFICAAYFTSVRVVDQFAMPFFNALTTTEDHALLLSDIAVWALPLSIFWLYWSFSVRNYTKTRLPSAGASNFQR